MGFFSRVHGKRAAVMKALAPIVAAVALCACERVDYLELKPETVIFRQANNEVWLQARALAHTGTQATRAAITWSSADPQVATIDAKGRGKPVKSGHTEFIARHDAIEARVPVDVLFTEKIEVTPKEVRVTEGGESVELKVRAFDYQGRELKDRSASYSASNKDVVSMGQNAVFGLSPGSGTVTVSIEGVKDTVNVVVEADKKAKK
jgi:hypothetical protein